MSASAGPSADASAAMQGQITSSDLLPADLPRATSIIVIGMAGSGKTTFTGSLQAYRERLAEEHANTASAESHATSGNATHAPTTPYFVNLDPAVSHLNYAPNVDIRDTIDYQRLMEEYNLGPNGGILTALNLFTTKFDQVLGILERRSNDVDHIVMDTPGQIEIFTWSASGTIITDALATAMPTVVAYIIDTPRTLAPATFMSNMLYACSIMYKTKLPFVLVFNKTDVQPHDFAIEWMNDFEKFQEALRINGNPTEPIPAAGAKARPRRNGGDGEDGSYMSSLMNSMALILDEFYSNLRAVGVSSTTHEGLDDFFKAVDKARQEYIDDYRPELDRIVRERAEQKQQEKKSQLDRMMRDMRLSKDGKGQGAAEDDEHEVDQEPQYEGDGQILDPDSDDDLREGDIADDDDASNFMGQNTLGGRTFGNDGSAWPGQFTRI